MVNGNFERAGFYGKGETLTTLTLNVAAISLDAVFAETHAAYYVALA